MIFLSASSPSASSSFSLLRRYDNCMPSVFATLSASLLLLFSRARARRSGSIAPPARPR